MLMNSPITLATARLQFDLTLECPGPSQGDAFEHLESLGVNPWAFEAIKPIGEVATGRMVTGTFEVVGAPSQVFDALATMIESRTPALSPVNK